MSKLSIYENSWIDLVFENKNKEYGAYQLRHDSAKNSYAALFMGLLFVASISAVLFFVNKINGTTPTNPTETIIIDDVIQVTDVNLKKYEQPLPSLPATRQSTPASVVEKSQLTNPVVVKSDVAVPEIAKNTENNIPMPQIAHGDGISTNTIPNVGTGNGSESSGNSDSSSEIVNSGVLDVMPAFPGGIEKFYKYVGTKFRQPDLESDQIFKVYVSFVIEKDGTMTDIKVLKDPGFGLGKEAIRVLQSLKTKWSPGIVNSKPVRTAYNLPIVIKAQ